MENHENKFMKNEDIEIDLDKIGEKVTGGAPQVARMIRLKGYRKVIDQAAGKTVNTAMREGSQVLVPTPIPTKKEIVTINRDNKGENT